MWVDGCIDRFIGVDERDREGRKFLMIECRAHRIPFLFLKCRDQVDSNGGGRSRDFLTELGRIGRQAM